MRYFGPLAEVPFCGHATIATAVAFAERHGPGERCYTGGPGTGHPPDDGAPDATLTSVTPTRPGGVGEPTKCSAIWAGGRGPGPGAAARIAYAGA